MGIKSILIRFSDGILSAISLSFIDGLLDLRFIGNFEQNSKLALTDFQKIGKDFNFL